MRPDRTSQILGSFDRVRPQASRWFSKTSRSLSHPATIAYGTAFDGSSDLRRGADLTGNADGKTGTISVWFRVKGADTSFLGIFAPDFQRFELSRVNDANGNVIRLFATNSVGAGILRIESTTSYTDRQWHHLVSSWDLAVAGTGRMYIDDVNVANVITYTNDTIDYTNGNFFIGAAAAGLSKWVGDIAELYINNTIYTDFDLRSNRRLVSNGDLRPVYIGENGENITGTSPIVYYKGNGDRTNRGTGGGFTENGTIVKGTRVT